MPPIIQIAGLKKAFKAAKRDKSTMLASVRSLFRPEYTTVKALDGIDLQIQPGEIRGLIGPNGAGKSTAIKILCGILYPTSGEVSVMGYVPWKEREKYVSQIGAVFGQKSQLWWDLPPIDAFELQKQMYKIPESVFARNIKYFEEILDAGEIVKRPARQLSLGERMKCELMCAMLHEPPLIYLDEPTIGLDAISKESIRAFIAQVKREKGTTFILTTHDLADIESLCEKVSIINHGKLVYDGMLSGLKSAFSDKKIIEMHFSAPIGEDALAGFPVLGFTGRSATVEAYPGPGQTMADVLKSLIHALPVEDINVNDLSIEEIIKQIYAKGKEGA